MEIETERLMLRNFTYGDVNDVFEYCTKNKDIFAVVWKKNGKVIGHLNERNKIPE